MSLTLRATTLALGPGLTASFLASGGAEPYTYSVLPNGVGGSIDSDGVYTAPSENVNGIDTVQVEDSLGATATAKMLVGLPLVLFCDVIQKELGLANGRVILWDQKFNMPKDDALVIAVRGTNFKPIGTATQYDGSGSGLEAVQSVSMNANLDINVMSRSAEARDRKEEVLLALLSPYSIQQQETNGFSISHLSNNFVDLSEVDGAAIPYRFVISVKIQYSFKKSKQTNYFDNFPSVGVTTEP